MSRFDLSKISAACIFFRNYLGMKSKTEFDDSNFVTATIYYIRYRCVSRWGDFEDAVEGDEKKESDVMSVLNCAIGVETLV